VKVATDGAGRGGSAHSAGKSCAPLRTTKIGVPSESQRSTRPGAHPIAPPAPRRYGVERAPGRFELPWRSTLSRAACAAVGDRRCDQRSVTWPQNAGALLVSPKGAAFLFYIIQKTADTMISGVEQLYQQEEAQGTVRGMTAGQTPVAVDPPSCQSPAPVPPAANPTDASPFPTGQEVQMPLIECEERGSPAAAQRV
jgi:hypothetical protein